MGMPSGIRGLHLHMTGCWGCTIVVGRNYDAKMGQQKH